MANEAQKAVLTAKIAGILKDLMVKTTAEQVYIDSNTTLAAKLAEVISALNGKAPSDHEHDLSSVQGLASALDSRPTTTEMHTAVSEAVGRLLDGAPETYDTLKEIAGYISEHSDVVAALNSAVGSKADRSAVTALQSTINAIKSTVDGLGALALKDSVAYSDLDSNLKTKIDNAAAGNHSHSNKSVLDKITSTDITNWNGKSKVHYSDTEPTMADNDLWVQLLN